MLSGWSRIFVFLAVAAVIANAHCFGNCASEACTSTKGPSSTCHHKKSPDQDTARCSHQHAEFAAPKAGDAKLNVVTVSAVLPAPSAVVGSILPEAVFLSSPEIGSPPGHLFNSTTSILRI
jgi:hypothetical protein